MRTQRPRSHRTVQYRAPQTTACARYVSVVCPAQETRSCRAGRPSFKPKSLQIFPFSSPLLAVTEMNLQRFWWQMHAHGRGLLAPLLLSALGGCATAPQPSVDVFSSLLQQSADRERLSAGGSKETSLSRRPVRHRNEPIVIPEEEAEPVVSAVLQLKRPPALVRQVIAPSRQNVAIDKSSSDTDLWARLRRGFFMPDLNSPLVQNREQWYASRPDYVQRMSERGSRYLFHIVEEVQSRNMPSELALLPFVESAFNPQALSSAKASGIWQFMPATGQSFDLRQNIFRDDRRDVLASTRAALDYLTKLHTMFGDWHLALAAYNWGEGNVQKAIARNRKAGLPTDYLNLQMPQETQQYVPKLLAMKNIIARPASFGLRLPALPNHPYFWSVPLERDIDLALAIELSGIDREEFMRLNPQSNKPVILAAGTPQLLLPYDNARRFVSNLKMHSGPTATWTAWTAPYRMRLSEAARQLGCSEAVLREVNSIPPSMLINAGSTLLVPRSRMRQDDVPMHLADNAMISLTPDTRAVRRVTLRSDQSDETSPGWQPQ